jgi:hypothetical protein
MGQNLTSDGAADIAISVLPTVGVKPLIAFWDKVDNTSINIKTASDDVKSIVRGFSQLSI